MDLKKGKRVIIKISPQAHKLFEPAHLRPHQASSIKDQTSIVFSSGANAYLKIAEGCNHRCAFCAIPGIRGKHRSRTIQKIAPEARSLLNQGFHELDIISQDITYYGHDLKDGTNLPALLRELGTIDTDFWIRLLYGYPTGVTDELLEVIATTPQICNYLDIPIQHSHPDVLKLMQRKATVPFVAQMVKRIHAALPDATIRTTCLVGFPGETEEHFQHLLQFCKEMKFDHLGTFIYSPEEDTTAYDMEPVPTLEEAQDRHNRLMEQQQSIAEEKNKNQIGNITKILLENQTGKNQWQGRTARQAPEVDGTTTIKNVPETAQKAQFIQAKITSHNNYDLTATAI